MIIFVLIVSAMVAIGLAFVLPPLLKGSPQDGDGPRSKEANIAIYRDQLTELERDLQNGIVSSEQYDLDRNDIMRRLLEDDAGSQEEPTRKPQKVAADRRSIYAFAALLPLSATALYLVIGNPHALSGDDGAGGAGLDRAASTTQAPPSGMGDFPEQRIQANVEALAKRLQQNPQDVQGWTMLARSYSSLKKYPEASAAYARVTELKPDDADLWADYAFTLAMANGRQFAGQPAELVARALAIDPENPKALQLAGDVAFEAKDYAKAMNYWQRLLQKVPANSEVAQSLNERINEARSLAGNSSSK